MNQGGDDPSRRRRVFPIRHQGQTVPGRFEPPARRVPVTGRKRYTAEEKVAILRRHFLEGERVSDLCEELGIAPQLFHRWQKILFDNGAAAFKRKRKRPEHETNLRPLLPVALLCLAMAIVKLTTGVHWSWWRVLLPAWVLLGYGLLYVATALIWSAIARATNPAFRASRWATIYEALALLSMFGFVDNLLRRIGPGESAWFWLASGRTETILLFGILNIAFHVLFWSRTVQRPPLGEGMPVVSGVALPPTP